METTVDLTGLASEPAIAELESAFNNLGNQGHVLVKGTSDFSSIMKTFQDSNWGKYDWLPVAVSKDEWSGYLVARGSGFSSIVQIMESHHKHCDTMYVTAENALNSGNEDEGKKLMAAFLWNMENHFQREENIIFPAFEQKTGMSGSGPTAVMRTEHQQIRGVLEEIKKSLDSGDYQEIFNQAETMLILIQQHNSKEENILYPMSDQHLGAEVDQLARTVQLIVHQ